MRVFTVEISQKKKHDGYCKGKNSIFTMPEVRQVRYSELTGNKFMKKLEPTMLAQQGCAEKRFVRPAGCKTREWVEVRYGREYVIDYLCNNVVLALSLQSLEQLLQLMIDVWLEAPDLPTLPCHEQARIKLKQLLNEYVGLSEQVQSKEDLLLTEQESSLPSAS